MGKQRRTHGEIEGGAENIGNCTGSVELISGGGLLEWRRLEGMPMPPTMANGKICYIEMPAADIARSAEFYKRVFGCNIRKRGDGSTAFDDTTGEVSGSWVLGRSPSGKPGLLFYIMVDSVVATVDTLVAEGGEIVQPIGEDAPRLRRGSAIREET